MPEQRYTTGKRYNRDVLWDAIFRPDGDLIALVDGEEEARLFAAAPELLAACEAAARFLDDPDPSLAAAESLGKLLDAALALARPAGRKETNP